MNKELQALERLINKCCDSCPYDGMVCEKATNDSCAAFRNYKMVKTALETNEKKLNLIKEILKDILTDYTDLESAMDEIKGVLSCNIK